ncbi:MAG: phenylalanine--tRNA ligase subunit alpha [bacterium]|nr:phenylalanine--tRNA ligase subunit alpha [bacterium]
MSNLEEHIRIAKQKFHQALQDTAPEAWETLKNTFLARKGIIAELFAMLAECTPEEKRHYGKTLNELKNEITEQIERLKSKVEFQLRPKRLDPTLPGKPYPYPRVHPLTQTLNRIVDTFARMGFVVEEGPELETAYYNFDALNTPIWHPAREKSDTLYILNSTSEYELLRTETSPVQIHALEKRGVPIRIISPGRVYRNDKPDATHSPVFHQVEGLCVDEKISMADLKGTLLGFYRAMLGSRIEIRFRPHFFPFTEPSAEVDVTCPFCYGNGCRICKQSGYIEMGGSGMVHPNVLKGVGVDMEKYSGFAFGLGVERLAMLLHGVDDIRLFYENDLRFLEQFA